MNAKVLLCLLVLGLSSVLLAFQYGSDFLLREGLFLSNRTITTTRDNRNKAKEKYVINLGLPKTGTSSFFREWQSILADSPSNASHWSLCFRKEGPWTIPKPKIKGCLRSVSNCARGMFTAIAEGHKNPFDLFMEDVRVFCQMDCVDWNVMMYPQIDLLDDFFSFFSPDEAIFVLTTRDSEKWFDSVDRWNTLRGRLIHHLRDRDESFRDERDEVLKKLEKTNRWMKNDEDLIRWKNDEDLKNVHKEMLIRFKEEHERNVFQQAAERGHKVFVFDLETPDLLKENLDEVVRLFFHGQPVKIPESYTWANHHSAKPKSETP